jgi:hypothetical protein
MDYVHDCFFCGWRREASSATVLEPRCERCGCAVRSGTRSNLASLPDDPAPASKSSASGIAPVVRLTAAFLTMFAAAQAGYAEAGPAISLAAFGAAGLVSVPLLVPSR